MEKNEIEEIQKIINSLKLTGNHGQFSPIQWKKAVMAAMITQNVEWAIVLKAHAQGLTVADMINLRQVILEGRDPDAACRALGSFGPVLGSDNSLSSEEVLILKPLALRTNNPFLAYKLLVTRSSLNLSASEIGILKHVALQTRDLEVCSEILENEEENDLFTSSELNGLKKISEK